MILLSNYDWVSHHTLKQPPWTREAQVTCTLQRNLVSGVIKPQTFEQN